MVILITGVVTGVLIHQKYLTIPEKLPFLSLWYCFNIGSSLDALFVLSRGGWKTNFLGFKPGNIRLSGSLSIFTFFCVFYLH